MVEGKTLDRAEMVRDLRSIVAELSSARSSGGGAQDLVTCLLGSLQIVTDGLSNLADDLEADPATQAPLSSHTNESLKSFRDLLVIARTRVTAWREVLGSTIATLERWIEE